MRKTLLFTFLILAPFAGLVTQPVAAVETAATQTVTLAVENMSCAACPITVRKALEKVPGVAKVKVDFDTKTATVTFDPAKTKVETLTRATTEAGYPSSLKR
jgi:mercuric ion binding protein